jgi:two-component system, OmpR family, sensor histidine kinase TctE
MMGGRFRSLQLRLAVRLALLYVAATMVGVGFLVYQAYETADTLNDRELSLRAADLARYDFVDASGMARLDLSPKLAASYETGSDADLFAIRGSDDRIIAASPPSFGETVAKWPVPTDDPSYFRLKNFGTAAQEYYGLSLQFGSAAGPLSIFVARAAGADALVHSLLREFLLDIAWIIPFLIIITLRPGDPQWAQARKRGFVDGRSDRPKRHFRKATGRQSSKRDPAIGRCSESRFRPPRARFRRAAPVHRQCRP